MNQFLLDNYMYVLMLHNLGFVLGLGGATTTDYLFFRFLKKGYLSEQEVKTMSMLSPLIWAGLALLILTGLGMFLPQREALLESAKFMSKMTIVAVITLNGILLNFFVSPKMMQTMRFRGETGTIRSWRRIAFVAGATSIVSWYSAFLLGLWRGIPFSYAEIITTYVIVLAGAILVGQIQEAYLHKAQKGREQV